MKIKEAKTQVLRYLGHRGQNISPQLDGIIEECILLMRKTAVPRHVFKILDLATQDDGILLETTNILLKGSDIRRHLAGCGQVMLFAATLGVFADDLIRRSEITDMTRALVLDACATQLIEESCDEIEKQACEIAAKQGLSIATRFSPGYGDLPLDIQPKLLSALDAGRKTGLTCTENLILLPRKSVTALIGIGKDINTKPKACGSCSLKESCSFKKGNANA